MPITTNLSEKEIRAIETRIEEYLKDLAVRKGIVKSREDVIVRSILPATDFGSPSFSPGFSIEDFAVTYSATGWQTVINGRLPDKKIVAFYGVRLAGSTPITSAIKFALGANGAKTKEIVQVEPALTTEEKEAIFEKPILYEDSQYMYVQYYAKSTGSDRVVLLGMVAEPKGEVISG